MDDDDDDGVRGVGGGGGVGGVEGWGWWWRMMMEDDDGGWWWRTMMEHEKKGRRAKRSLSNFLTSEIRGFRWSAYPTSCWQTFRFPQKPNPTVKCEELENKNLPMTQDLK
jgi:hypothetical protein